MLTRSVTESGTCPEGILSQKWSKIISGKTKYKFSVLSFHACLNYNAEMSCQVRLNPSMQIWSWYKLGSSGSSDLDIRPQRPVPNTSSAPVEHICQLVSAKYFQNHPQMNVNVIGRTPVSSWPWPWPIFHFWPWGYEHCTRHIVLNW